MIKIVLIIILSMVAFILVLVGVGFLISSLYFYFLTIVASKTLAALFCGAAFLLIAILLLLIAVLIKSSLFKFKAPKLQAKLKSITDDPAAEALNIVKEYPFRSAFVAVTSGFVLGLCPKLRDSLIEGVTTYMQTGSVADSLKSMKSKEDDASC